MGKHFNLSDIFILIIVIASFCGTVLPQKNLNNYLPVKRYDFHIITSDSISLDCSKFIPLGRTPPAHWPVIIYCHGFGDSKETESSNAFNQAQYGYYTVVYSMRGQGHSGGLSNLISTVEMNDLFLVINYVKNDISADSNRIAVFGASQGGIIPFMAACNGAKILTVMSDLASPEFASSWIENGSVKITLFWSVDYDSTIVRYTTNVKNIRSWILSNENDKWDSLSLYLPKGRDFLNKVPDCSVPILITDAWQDKFFNAAGMIKATRLLKAPFLAYFGAVDGHGSDTSFAENNFISKWDNHWFEHWFLNLCPNLFDSALFHYASTVFPVTNNHWSFKHLSSKTWPPEIEVPLRLYLQPKRKLEGFICKIFSDTAGFWNDIKDSTFTMQEAINTSFKEPFYSSRFSKNTLEFDSNPLVTDIQFTGIPILRLFYSSTADLCQYNAQIWEVKPSGESHFVTRINYTDRHYIQGTLKEKIIEGPANSHSFRHGNKIRVIFTNLDTQPEDSFLSSNPFVLPVLKKAYNTIYFGKEKPSYIELPVIESVDSIQSPINIFSTLQLFQNYPNPFNPLTNIRYNLKKRSHVELKIYDFLGKKRVTLVHSVQLPGTHIVSLNSNTANLSSGVYFYEVKVGDAVKRMKMVVSN